MEDEKSIRWVGSSYEDLLAFPKDARKEAGFQLGKVQAGLEPADWKSFDDVGVGTKEIRIRDASGIYRVMYVAKYEEAVYVLVAFGLLRFVAAILEARSAVRPERDDLGRVLREGREAGKGCERTDGE